MFILFSRELKHRRSNRESGERREARNVARRLWRHISRGAAALRHAECGRAARALLALGTAGRALALTAGHRAPLARFAAFLRRLAARGAVADGAAVVGVARFDRLHLGAALARLTRQAFEVARAVVAVAVLIARRTRRRSRLGAQFIFAHEAAVARVAITRAAKATGRRHFARRRRRALTRQTRFTHRRAKSRAVLPLRARLAHALLLLIDASVTDEFALERRVAFRCRRAALGAERAEFVAVEVGVLFRAVAVHLFLHANVF